jgi:hypothetical protein
MEKQVWIEPIEFNQNPSGNRKPEGCQNRRSRKIFDKILHEFSPSKSAKKRKLAG